MTTALVGYTGFVGSNLESQHIFDTVYNSKNISDAYGTNPDILVYAGIRAEKFIANKFPEQDLASVEEAFENIIKINPEKIVLISSVDVYHTPVNVDEDTKISVEDLAAYGKHRYMVEKWVSERFDDHHIIRLPALFGKNLKKNFLYDYLNVIPSQLDEKKFTEIAHLNPLIEQHYRKEDTGYYKCQPLSLAERKELKTCFSSIGFSALNFTDSRAVFQYYNLAHLWMDISIAIENDIHILNIATEPIKASDLYSYLCGSEFINELNKPIPHYDFRTKYASLFGGENGYIQTSGDVLKEIKQFVLGDKL